MRALGDRGAGRPAVSVLRFRLLAAALAIAFAGGCDDTVQPLHEDEDAIFSMFGYLDLGADTQWVRVMPVRETLFLDPEPIDAVVTLEHVGSGRTVTLSDSLFAFVGGPLEGVAYAYNFWTTEPLEAEATYRLRSERSDGASSTAVIVMPPALDVLFLDDGKGRRGPPLGQLQVRAERVLFVELLYTVGKLSTDRTDTLPATPVAAGSHWTFAIPGPGTEGVGVNADSLPLPDLVDMERWEILVVTGRLDWPFHPGLSDLTVLLPNTMPSNVESGLGFVGGVATRRIPFDACDVLTPRPDGEPSCATRLDARSASVAGRVMREPCGDPHTLATIRLTETLAGGAVIRTWKTGWRGDYRFVGIEPGAELRLEIGAEAVELPPLVDGERYTVDDISVAAGC